jgi:hypothetical protein
VRSGRASRCKPRDCSQHRYRCRKSDIFRQHGSVPLPRRCASGHRNASVDHISDYRRVIGIHRPAKSEAAK